MKSQKFRYKNVNKEGIIDFLTFRLLRRPLRQSGPVKIVRLNRVKLHNGIDGYEINRRYR